MATDLSASFAVETEADSSETDALAASLSKVHDRMVENQRSVSELNAGLRRLKGSSAVSTDEFKAMREELTAKKAALASDQVQLVKLGGSMTDATKKVELFKASKSAQASKAAEQSKAQAEAAKEQARSQEALAAKLIAQAQKHGEQALRLKSQQQAQAKKEADALVSSERKKQAARVESAKKAQTAAAELANSSSLVGMAAEGAAGVVASAMKYIYAAIAAAVVAFVAFGFAAADAARSARLLREATTGSAAGAASLDKEISGLVSRLPGARAGLEELGLALVRAGFGGNALKLAFSAVATTAAVMGAAAGGILQGIAERAKMAKRFVLGAFDLKGSGLHIDDVARALAGRLKISFLAAKGAIQNGQVGLEVGLAAMDDAVQKRFGAIARKMKLALPAQIAKAGDDIGRLFKDVNVEPGLAGLQSILGLLDENTESGAALKVIFETLLNPLSEGFGEVAPYLKSFLQGAIIGALMFVVALLQVRNELKAALGGTDMGKLDLMSAAFTIGAGAVWLFAQGLIITAKAAAGVIAMAAAIIGTFSAVYDYISSIDFGAVGTRLIDGLVGGIKSGAGFVMDAVRNLADKMLATIKSALLIFSPSRKTKSLGKFTAQGFAGGIEDGTEDVVDAAEGMARAPVDAAAGAGGAGGGGGGRSSGGRGVTIGTLNINGVEHPEQLADPSFLDKLADAIGKAARAGGAPLVEVTV